MLQKKSFQNKGGRLGAGAGQKKGREDPPQGLVRFVEAYWPPTFTLPTLVSDFTFWP